MKGWSYGHNENTYFDVFPSKYDLNDTNSTSSCLPSMVSQSRIDRVTHFLKFNKRRLAN